MSDSSLTQLLSRSESMNSSTRSMLGLSSKKSEVDIYGNPVMHTSEDLGSSGVCDREPQFSVQKPMFHEVNPKMWISRILKIDNSVGKFFAALVYAIFAFPVFLIDLSCNMEGARPPRMGPTDEGWSPQ